MRMVALDGGLDGGLALLHHHRYLVLASPCRLLSGGPPAVARSSLEPFEGDGSLLEVILGVTLTFIVVVIVITGAGSLVVVLLVLLLELTF
jgi:hypothetical protein